MFPDWASPARCLGVLAHLSAFVALRRYVSTSFQSTATAVLDSLIALYSSKSLYLLPQIGLAKMLVSLTVGKVDAGVAVLLTQDNRLVGHRSGEEYPLFLHSG
jgi:hypothetical protein